MSDRKVKNTSSFLLFALSVERQADGLYVSQMHTGYYQAVKFPQAKK